MNGDRMRNGTNVLIAGGGMRIRSSPEVSSKTLENDSFDKSLNSKSSGRRNSSSFNQKNNDDISSSSSTSSSSSSSSSRIGRLVPPRSSSASSLSPSTAHMFNHHQQTSSSSWRRNVSDNLSFRWRVLGGCGMMCLAFSSLSILWLNNTDIFIPSPKSNDRQKGSLPDWFSDRSIPKLFSRYVDKYRRAVNNPQHSQSRFLIHEIPMNETQLVDTILGLVSTIMLGIVTDRAVLIDWTDPWMTPLDFSTPTTPSKTDPTDSSSSTTTSSTSTSSSSVGGIGWDFGQLFGGGGGYDDGTSSNIDDINDDMNQHGGGDAKDNNDLNSNNQWSSSFNATASRRARLVRLKDVLAEPVGLSWDYQEFVKKRNDQGQANPNPTLWDPVASIEEITCSDLKNILGKENKYVKISPKSSLLYYMPLILVNPLFSDDLEDSFQGGLGWAFADTINYFIRPVSEVIDAIDRFKVRYMDGNTVVGMQMSIMPGHGAWSGDGMMPLKQQELFFTTASLLVTPSPSSGGGSSSSSYYTDADSSSSSDGGVVYLLITDNQNQIQGRFQELEAADQINGAGVVAILSPNGDGPPRIQLELQELWMLGIADLALVTPGSKTGIVGAARTRTTPHVIMSEDDVHQSTAPYPCFAQFGSIQHTSCFIPSMLSKIPVDSLVPC